MRQFRINALVSIFIPAFFGLAQAGRPGEAARATGGWETTPTARIADPRLDEISGIASARRPGEYWAHNDHGNKPALYRVNGQGIVLQRVGLEEAKNTDWEAMASDGAGTLWICDTGDNRLQRKKYRIHEIREPDTNSEAVKPEKTRVFRYPDKESHNCEAAVCIKGYLYIITKESDADKRPIVFRLETGEDADTKEEKTRARQVGRLTIRGAVSDAAWSESRGELAVLTSHGLSFFHVREESDLFRQPFHETRLRLGNCEALCYDGDSLVLTSETGDLWKYPATFFLGQDSLRRAGMP